MNKKAALAIASGLSVLIALNYFFFMDISSYDDAFYERVVVQRAIDGDTVELEDGRVVRLLNINTPEKGETGSEEAQAFLRKFENQSVELDVTGTEKYGRLLGRIYAPDYLNLELVKSGLAHIFLVDQKELEIFNRVQTEAINLQAGIWRHSEKYNCLSGEIDKKSEILVLTRECDISLEEWTVKDESTKNYTFEKKEYPKKFALYSEKGTDNETALFWGRGSVWNDDKDSLFVRDARGFLVFYYSYGY